MAVFTKVSLDDLNEPLARFELGEIVRLEGISAGIENTNYFLDTRKNGETKHWVLTVFENVPSAELPFFAELTGHLAREGLAVPSPVRDANGEAIFQLHGKDVMIVPCLKGKAKTSMSTEDCAQAGSWLGLMHKVVAGYTEHRALVRDLNWMQGYLSRLEKSEMPVPELKLLRECITRYSEYRSLLEQCPLGTVHGDLFRDNVLFDGTQIAGVIDFYHACTAGLLFDLAVCANDWTCDDQGRHDSQKLHALVQAYQAERSWTELEHEMWPRFLEVAALRFWISRLASKYLQGYQQDSVAGETIKDPDEMRRILEHVLYSDASFQ